MKSALLYSAARNAFKNADAIRLVKALDASSTVSEFRVPQVGERYLNLSGRYIFSCVSAGDTARSAVNAHGKRWIVVNDVPKSLTPEERIAASKGIWTWQGWTVDTLATAGKRVIDFRIPKPGETIVNNQRGTTEAFLLNDTRKWSLEVPIVEDIESPQMQAAKRWAAKNNCKVVGVGATKGQYCLSNWSNPDLDTKSSTNITTVQWSPEYKQAFRVAPLEGYVFEKHAKEPERFVSVPIVKAAPADFLSTVRVEDKFDWTTEKLAERGFKAVAVRSPGKGEWYINHASKWGLNTDLKQKNRNDWSPQCVILEPIAPATVASAKPVLVANVDDFAAHLKAAITEYFKGSVLDGGRIAERSTKLAVDSLLESALLGVKERKLTREQCLALGLGKEARAAQCRVQCGYGK